MGVIRLFKVTSYQEKNHKFTPNRIKKMIECIAFDLSRIDNLDDIPTVAKNILHHFLEGDSIEQLAEEYRVNGDFIEEVIREVSRKVGADMIVEVLLDA